LERLSSDCTGETRLTFPGFKRLGRHSDSSPIPGKHSYPFELRTACFEL